MADVFISYDSADRAIADKIASGLSNAGLSVWWDRNIQAGVRFNKELNRQIEAAKAVVVLWSKASQDSDWVHDEAQLARDANKLIPVRIDSTLPPLGFRQVQSLDMHDWNGDPGQHTFEVLLSSLRRLLGDAAPKTQTNASPNHPPAAIRRTWNKRWLIAGTAALAIVVLALIVLQSRVSTPSAAGNDGRIEIDTFEPVTRTDELEHFAKRVTDTVVRVFATNDIKAVTRSRAGVEESPSSSGSEFGLRGTVDRDGDKFVVNADVLHQREGLVLWSTSTRLDVARNRILENQFSTSIASVLRCALNLRRDSKNDPSTDLFSRFLGICAAFNLGQFDQASELARRIVDFAPQYAASYAIRAAANALLINSSHKPDTEVARLRNLVYEDARSAEQMDATVDSYTARAIIDDPAVGLAARERLLLKGIEVDRVGFALNQHGNLLLRVGRIHDALNTFELAVSANRLDWASAVEVARATAWTGNVEFARKRFDDLREEHPDPYIDWVQFWTELEMGDAAIAKRISETYGTVWTGFGKMFLATDYPCGRAFLDARVRGVRPSSAEIEAACSDPDFAPTLATALGYFGYVDPALHQWETGAMSQGWRATLFTPYNRPLRADPRFMRVAAQFGLVDYWLDSDHWPDFCKEDKLPYNCKDAALAVRANGSTTARPEPAPPPS